METGGLDELFGWISEFAPSFSINGNDVTVLAEPDSFYQVLKKKSASAKERIFLTSLYLGTGKLEQELVDAIGEGLASNKVKLVVLLDHSRGSRGDPNSRTTLLPLIQKYSDNVTVALYHTPDLRGFLKRWMPERFNETIGLQHMKIYLFDDSLIISGANLSDTYFTNRQDRYYLFDRCKPLCDFFAGLIDIIVRYSFQLSSDNQLEIRDSSLEHPYEGDKTTYINQVSSDVSSYLARYRTKKAESGDTWVFPLFQMNPFNVNLDETVTRRLFQTAPSESRLYLATGYFNLTDDYKEEILHRSWTQFDILTASPQANGFLNAGGMAGAIPAAYTFVESEFLNAVNNFRQEHRIRMWEYSRDRWTFHGKGLWYFHRNVPVLTLIGSPNFGFRSVFRDLEAQVAVVTTNPNLQAQMLEEQRSLYSSSSLVNDQVLQRLERRVPLWVKYFMRTFRTYF